MPRVSVERDAGLTRRQIGVTWMSNGATRHAVANDSDGIEALCGAVRKLDYEHMPGAPCLACLHAVWCDYQR